MPKGYVIHKTNDIVAVATKNSTNRKTGPGIQIWILDARLHPHESRKSGEDALRQCRGCPHASYHGCYVFSPTLSVIYKAWKSGKYPHLYMTEPEWDAFFDGEYVRFGAYGNPSVLPLAMISDIADRSRRHTGYFHDWHLMKPEKAAAYGRYLMASCESSNYHQAKALGLRTFTTGSGVGSSHGIQCLADTHGTPCGKCGLCDGLARRSDLPDVWIDPHGYQAKKAKLN